MHVLHIGAHPKAIRGLYRGGHEITVLYEAADGDRMYRTPGLRELATRACAVDSYRHVEALWSALHHLGPMPKVDAVLTTNEYGVVGSAILGKQLDAIALDPAVALACRDKALQKTKWREADVPTAKFVVLPEAAAQSVDAVRTLLAAAGLEFPVVVKPPAAGGAESVSVAETAHDIVRVARHDPQLRRVLVEEFIDGPEWHFDGIIQNGSIGRLMVSRYGEPLLCTKQGEPTRSMGLPPAKHRGAYAAANEFATRALKALGLETGVFHFEAFGHPGEFVANELACRPGGSGLWTVAEKTIGLDLFAAATQLFTGDEVETLTASPDKVHGWVHLPSVAGFPNTVHEADIRAIPGVDDVVLVPLGVPMRDMSETSSAGIGYATVAAADEAECWHVMAEAVARVRAIHDERGRAALQARSTVASVGAPLRLTHRAPAMGMR
ncbi:acetyl-CoA carboxylase biotin carboxylase subunit family protein [Streptomyces sp. ISL-94]|uniref:ATP-grasp domain-containing protein n=1 Tax=Streptomyces sp. ISL-94 TaxID=2819190 RepID=UPI001BEA9B53|nr:ATP-grasp domain-containing protein [Streptomyces sp. ISL-94]MBT2480473.1 ATP-grasp domain-containing protein [Streptomyces sp. ISL-94]